MIRIINFIIQFLFLRIWLIDCSFVNCKSYYTLIIGIVPFTGMCEWNRPACFIYDKIKYYDFFDWVGIRKINKSKLTDTNSPPVDLFLKWHER